MLTAQNCRCAHEVPREFERNEDHRCGKQLRVELGEGVTAADLGADRWVDPGMERLDQALLRVGWEQRAEFEGVPVKDGRKYADEFEDFCIAGAEVEDVDAYRDFCRERLAEAGGLDGEGLTAEAFHDELEAEAII